MFKPLALVAAVLTAFSVNAFAAKTELTVYTALEAEQLKSYKQAFEKANPDIGIKWVRDSTGIITAKLLAEKARPQADAVWGLAASSLAILDQQGMLQPYAPNDLSKIGPNYRDAANPPAWVGMDVWAATICFNTIEAEKQGLSKPVSWQDLTKPEYKGKQIGQVVGPSGGTTWTRVMFERQVLGEDYWQKQAALGIALYPSGAPTSDELVRGEISIAPLLYNIIYTKIVEGAPAEAIFAPEGVPIVPYADGITKTSKSPNAARLFMNWRLSKEGQTFQITKLGNLTSLKEPPALPKGWDPKVVKVWVPNFEQFEKLRDPWMADWNKTYGYRQ